MNIITKGIGILALYIAASSCSVQNSAISYGGITPDKQNKHLYKTSSKYSYNFYLADTTEMRKYTDYHNNFISSEDLDESHARGRLKVFGNKEVILENAYIRNDTVFIDKLVDTNGDGKLDYRMLDYSTHRDTVDKDGTECKIIFWGSKKINVTKLDKEDYAILYGRLSPVLDFTAGIAKAGENDYRKFSKESYIKMLSIDRAKLDEWKKSHRERTDDTDAR